MNSTQSIWLTALDWLLKKENQLHAVFPAELPPENTPGFWFHVAQVEMSTRDTLSAKIQALVKEEEPPAMTPLDLWLYRRRAEWAAQLAFAKAQENPHPNVQLPELLEWLLIGSWETDGCIGLWMHAERDGKPHPENPDGLSPM